MNPHVFRAYDIRGVATKTTPFAEALGRPTALLQRQATRRVGWTRLSSGAC